jgi:hypothetical protein
MVAALPPRAGVLAAALVLAGCGARSSLAEPPPPDPCALPAGSSAVQLGDASWQTGASLALDGRGFPILAGAFAGSLTAAGTTLHAPVPKLDDLQIPSPRLLSGSFFLARLAPAECSGFAVAWSPMAQPADSVRIATDGDDVVLTAAYHGAVDFGGGPIGAGDELLHGAVVRLGPDGAHRWSRALGGVHDVSAPALDGAGNTFVSGWFCDTLAFEGQVLGTSQLPGTACDGFLLAIDRDGALAWSRILRLGTVPAYINGARPLVPAAWPSGDVSLVGSLYVAQSAEVDLGDGPLSTSLGDPSFATTFSSTGEHRWRALFPQPAAAMAIDPSADRLVIAGDWYLAEDGTDQGAVFSLDPSGVQSSVVMLPSFADAANLSGLAVGADGTLLFSGTRHGGAAKPTAMFLYATDASGAERWSREIDAVSPGDALLAGALLRPDGAAVLAGGFVDTVDFPSGPLSTEGNAPDAFVAVLRP